MEMKPIKIGMLGLGTVGSGVVRIVERHQLDLQRQAAAPIHIEKICVKNKQKQRKVDIDRDKLTEDAYDVIRDPDIDVIIEVMGGVEETKSYILAALEHGKHVVTANKDLMARHGSEILEKAAANGCEVLYEASVAGGIPILRTLVEGFSSDRITKIMGIVNGTTNYILSKMSREGISYDQALGEASALGYAEADPTSDVEGLDAAYKMTILGRLGFHTDVSIDDVSVTGITSISAADIAYGKRLGYEVKLLGIAERQDDYIHLSVEPAMIQNRHPLASVDGVFNAVYVYGEAVGETMFYGPGAGEMPTATSVVADLVAICKNLKLGVAGMRTRPVLKEKKLKSDEQIASKNFLRLHVPDRAGVLARVTETFAACDVSLESVLQQPFADAKEAEITIITHHANKANMKRVLARLSELDAVYTVRSHYRVEG